MRANHVLLLLTVVLTLPSRPAWPLEWTLDVVDSLGDVGECNSLAVDTSGNPHISYYDTTNRDLKYAVWNGSAWAIQTVESEESVMRYSSLALAWGVSPRISYNTGSPYGTEDNLKYAAWNGTSWTTQTVANFGYEGQWNSLALAGDNPHITYYYYDHNTRALKYSFWNGLFWETETVGGEYGGGRYTSLALDGAGKAHVAYEDWQSHQLKYARRDGLTWDIQTVDDTAGVGTDASLALDMAGNPHISYFDGTNYHLKYAKWNGSTWETQTVDSGTFITGQSTSIAIDPHGNPHISYLDITELSRGQLKHAAWNGSVWLIETVDASLNVGQATSLAIDQAGNVHISYYDYNNHDLKYAVGVIAEPGMLLVLALGLPLPFLRRRLA